MAWVFEDIPKNPKFLDQAAANNVEAMGHHIGLITFPRCGNTFMRKYMQNITGIITGADMDLMETGVFQSGAMPGEEITDASVWIKKSHDPFKPPGVSNIHKCNKAICVVRNPYDAFISMISFISGDHAGGLNQDMQKDIPAVWQEFVRTFTQKFKDYHSMLILDVMEHVPVHFIRYEDLLTKPQETLEGMFAFIMNQKSVEGLNIQKRIKAVIEMGHKATEAYGMKVDVTLAGDKK